MARKFGENRMDISKAKLFWRTQGECWRRMVTPYIMYLFMSMLLLATQTIENPELFWLRCLLGIVCILIGAAFNAHLAYGTGAMHYDAYLTGCIHRRNREQGIMSGGDHRPEREYAAWKGFYIGLLIGIPVVIFAGLSCIPGAIVNSFGQFFLVMFAGFAIVPVSWCFPIDPETNQSALALHPGYYAYSMLMVLLPIIITGVFYIIGAMVEKRRKQAISAQEEAAEAAKNAPKEYREQTEEQRRKTLQSKKKKK